MPGRTSIYQKTNQLIPAYDTANDTSFMNDPNFQEEELYKQAFKSVSKELNEVARQQVEAGQKQSNSLNSLKNSTFDRYKDIKLSIHGKGFVFADYDAFTNQKTY